MYIVVRSCKDFLLIIMQHRVYARNDAKVLKFKIIAYNKRGI